MKAAFLAGVFSGIVIVILTIAVGATVHASPYPDVQTVTVQRGQTLSEIAADWPGGWTRAAYVNDLDSPDLLAPGQRLVVPLTDGPSWTPPVPRRPEVAASRAGGYTATATGATGDVWASLAQCESGGTNARTGNGFTGYFQFTDATFQSLGYSGSAADHPYAVQLEAAQRLQARSGWGQWPGCAAKLGLL